MATLVTPQDPFIGAIIGSEFTITEKIGMGGMGSVYKATQQLTQRPVALKILHRHLINEEMLIRFENEAKVISRLNHPNIVVVFKYGQHCDGALYIAMEFLDGKNLAKIIEGVGVIGVPRAIPLMIQVADALGYAHEQKIVHRDIKPENIIIVKSGRHESIKLLDFGISKIIDEDYYKTKTGTVFGSPPYMAPEQWKQDRHIDGRIDIYAVGCVYFNMLTGQIPFNADSIPGFMNAHLNHKPQSPDEVTKALAAYPEINQVVLKCIQRNKEDRYQDAYDLADVLREIEVKYHDIMGSSSDKLSEPAHITYKEPKGSPPDRPAVILAESAAGKSAPSIDMAKIKAFSLNENIPSAELIVDFEEKVATAGVRKKKDPDASPPEVKMARTNKRSWLFYTGLILGLLLLVFAGYGFFFTDLFTVIQNRGKVIPVVKHGISGKKILLGMSGPFSGTNQEIGRAVRLGVMLCLHGVNEQGGVFGRKFQLISLDDEYDPAKALQNIKDLLEKWGVFAFIGNYESSATPSIIKLLLEKQVLFFAPYSGAAHLRKDPPDRYVFTVDSAAEHEIEVVVNYLLKTRGVKASEIAVFTQNDFFGNDGFQDVQKALKRNGYTGKTLRVGYPRNTVKVDAAVEQIVQNRDKLAAVIMVTTYRQAATFVRFIKNKGVDHLIFVALSDVGMAHLAEEFREQAPEQGEGLIVTSTVPSVESASTGVIKFKRLLNKYAPSEHPSSESLEAFIGAEILVEGLKRAGKRFDTEKLIDAIESIQNLDLGFGKKIDFGPSDHIASDKVWGFELGADGKYKQIELD